MDYKKVYEMWLEDDYIDSKTKEELKSIAGNDDEIKERFMKDLEFGTGGLRGILGAGPNRMNIYTVRKATQGLSNYILKQGKELADMGVCIAYDSRHMSPEFAKESALVLCGNGIKAYIFESLRATPQLSYATRELGCTAGIVITASHNPAEYNGYKAYWNDGAQVVSPRDVDIIEEVNKITNFSSIKLADEKEATEKGLFNIVESKIDDSYTEQVLAQRVNPEITKEMGDKLSVVYTALNGTGNLPMRRILKEAGYTNVHIVKEQEMPDSNFTTVGYPNPEDPNAFKLAMKLADEVNPDLIMATDPDADRLGVVLKNDNGEYVVLSGNMIGILLVEYILSSKKANNTLPSNGAVISTIVSTDLTQAICDNYGVKFLQVLTGFKFIGEKIKEYEATNEHEFLFGFEESNGYLTGTYARDKDAMVAGMLVCELASAYKKRGLSLYDGIQEIFKKYGYYKELSKSITLAGLKGGENINNIMKGLRETPPDSLCGVKVTEIRDYKSSEMVKDGVKSTINLPKSNVLYYVLEDSSWLCVRPSGTEPKIKVYSGVKEDSQKAADDKIAKLLDDMVSITDKYIVE